LKANFSSRSRSKSPNPSIRRPASPVLSSTSALSNQPPIPSGTGSGPSDKGSRDGVVRAIASFRTILNVSEKALDGLPVWGPKAAVGAVSEALKAFQVS
jgi:hypothetical protein